MMPLLQPSRFLEQEELEALTLQLLKMKQLLADSRQQLAIRQRSEADLEAQLAEERAARASLDSQRQQLCSELDMMRRRQEEQENSLRQLEERERQKHEKVDQLSAQLLVVTSELTRSNEALATAYKAIEGREEEIGIARQHLAKKVRETARLHVQLEEAEQQARVLQNDRNHLLPQVESLKGEVGRLHKREAQLQEQLREQQVAAEAKQAQVKCDYLKMLEQWKEAETQLQKLRLLEQQQQQLRALLEVEPSMRMRQNLFDE